MQKTCSFLNSKISKFCAFKWIKSFQEFYLIANSSHLLVRSPNFGLQEILNRYKQNESRTFLVIVKFILNVPVENFVIIITAKHFIMNLYLAHFLEKLWTLELFRFWNEIWNFLILEVTYWRCILTLNEMYLKYLCHL